MSAPGRRRALTLAALFGLAGAYFAVGAPLTFEWIDEGQVVYGCWRWAAGAVPYRDFQHFYWPSHFALNGALLRLFGVDLRVLRVSLVVLKALLALLVFVVARRMARGPFALAAYATCVALFGLPVWVFNTPYASHYTLVCAFAGLLLLLTADGRVARLAAAGVFFGLGATFKQSTGAFATGAALLFLALTPAPGPPVAESSFARALRAVLVAGAAAVPVGYAMKPPTGTGLLLAVPWLASLVGVALFRDAVRGPTASVRELLAFVGGAAVPPLFWILRCAALGTLPGLIDDTLTRLPAAIHWLVPLTAPPASVVLDFGIVASLLAGLAAPRRGLRMGALALSAVLGGSRVWTGSGWLGDLYHAALWLPLGTAMLSTIFFCRLRWNPPDAAARCAALVHWQACSMLMALYPGVDAMHGAMILPVFLPLLACFADRVQQRASPSAARRLLVGAALAGVAVACTAPLVLSLVRARAAYPPGGGGLRRATGIWSPDPRLEDTARLIDLLDEIAPPGDRLLMLPTEQVTYVLSNRVSALEREEIVLYFVAVGLMEPADAQRLADQPAMIAKLDATHPIVVSWLEGPGMVHFREAFPALASWIERHYRIRATIGRYQVLEWASR